MLNPERNSTWTPQQYMAQVDDLIVHTLREDTAVQLIYRVVSIQLGAINESGVVEIAPLDHKCGDVYDLGRINHYIPHVMFDQMVRHGILQCVWRKPGPRTTQPRKEPTK